ncbi:MAG TPA: DUF4124 domain-containing protein [Methylophilus sp.]
MNAIVGFILILLSFQLQAAIYVCKTAAGSTSYQDTPCRVRMVGQLRNVPDAPIEDQLRVQASIQSAEANYQARMAQREVESQQAIEQARMQLALAIENKKLALLQQQAQEAQQTSDFILVNRPLVRKGWRQSPALPHQQAHHARKARQNDGHRQFRSRVQIDIRHP